MRRIATLLPLALAACWTVPESPDISQMLVLCVENATAGYGNVVARAEQHRIEVLPGQMVCREIRASASMMTITAETTSGGLAGRLSFATRLPSAGPGCWQWTLASASGPQGSLLPCERDPELS